MEPVNIPKPIQTFARWFVLALIIAVVLWDLDLYRYLTLQNLKDHQQLLYTWAQIHYGWAICLYVSVYILALMLCLPCNFIFAIMGGILFGFWQGVILSVFCATVGSTLNFLIIKWFFVDVMSFQRKQWMTRMEKGFRENALNYILVLRLVPIFPFWLINIASAFLKVSTRIFVLGTLLGVIPSEVISVSLGQRFSVLMVSNQAITPAIFLQPQTFFTLLGLAVLALLPVGYKLVKAQ